MSINHLIFKSNNNNTRGYKHNKSLTIKSCLNPPPPKRRMRRDHTYISIGLKSTNNSHMCDNCKEFQMRRDGVSGRCPGKNATSNCEIPWTIKGRINKYTSY